MSNRGPWSTPDPEIAYLQWYGVKADGTTDDTVAVQACIDANKGKTIVNSSGTVLVAGLSLSGSSYDNTRIICDGGEFKLKADAGASTFGGMWIGLLVKDCDRVVIDTKWNGNRSAMTDREQIACVGIAGASRTKVPRLDVREIRGDGLYIGQSSYTANSTNPTDIEVGAVIATNTADDGRNAVSVIACTGLTIDTVISRKVGGTVAGNLMPGGLDIEPDFGYQTCTDIHVKSVRVTTAGYAGVSIFGKSISGVDATRDWNCTFIQIDDFYVQRTGTSGSGIAGSPFARMSDCRIKGVLKYATTRGVGIDIDFAQRINGEFRVQNVTQGVKVGAVNEVRDFEIDVRASDYDTAGLRTCFVTRGRFTGHIYGAIAASTSFAIQCHDEGRGGITQNNIRYEVDAPYDTVNARAFRNEPTNLVTFSLCEICDCNYTGYASVPVTIDASITKVNVRGLNYAGAIPSTGQWVTGDIVYNDTPAIDASSMIQMGWIRLTTGTGNVAGTDWAYARVSNVSPAV